MPELTSASVPPVGDGDHVRGDGAEAIVYLDLACPACAVTWEGLQGLPLRLCFRHFPLASRRPRSPALHAAAEACAAQGEGAFWEFVDSVYRDQGRTDDPHLWERVRELGLDLERFERERRSARVAARVRTDFESAIRAGVAGTPTAFAAGRIIASEVAPALGRLAHL